MASQARELADKSIAPPGRRNLIINGAMNVAQRGTSITNFTGNSQYHTVDRFVYENSGPSSADFAQVTDAPSGFRKSLKATLNGAFNPSASQYFIPFQQRIESQDIVFLDYGTANAKTVTLSFWIKSNKTGTYVVEFSNNSKTRKWSQSYTINAANTWEQKIITWTGDTGAGTSFDDDNESGAAFYWWMSGGTTFTSGSLSGAWEDGNNANRAVGVPSSLADDDQFYLTGVQLEVGTVATEFEHRSFGEELALCQRYFCKSFRPDVAPTQDFFHQNDAVSGSITAYSSTTGYVSGQIKFPVTMRALPDIVFYQTSLGSTSNRWQYFKAGSGWGDLSTNSPDNKTQDGFRPSVTGTFTVNQFILYFGGYTAEAEL